jgi:predicted enzyme related to lactoylglutathione lyase
MDVHTRLLVDDFAGCYRFYRDLMGLEVAFGNEDAGYADFRAGDSAFSLFLRAEMEEVTGRLDEPRGDQARDQVVLVFGVEDLESRVTELTKKGANFVTTVQSSPEWGIRTAHLRDPAGHLIELNEPLEQSAQAEFSG